MQWRAGELAFALVVRIKIIFSTSIRKVRATVLTGATRNLLSSHEDFAMTSLRLRVEADRRELDRVGIILPSGKDSAPLYSEQQILKMEERLRQLNLQTVHLDSKAIDGRFLAELERLDWVIIDIGVEACAGGLPAFLHGYFMPQMRLIRTAGSQPRSPLEATLLAAFDVGYPKDIIRWSEQRNSRPRTRSATHNPL
jgi:hypothetical protein